ncbi:MAG TPA: sugar ABC transporter permease [Ruminococcaceae bacterium]|jgi:simple sugar transport system permease protein|nr:sugar ABC transporter permease [Oscillospiraceae bacterium]
MLNNLTLLVSITFMYSAPLIFGALGGVTSERAGVVNIGIEGMMNIGAFAGTAVCYFTGNPWLGFLAAGLAGGLLALLHAVAAVTCRADQTISGIALNLIGPGFALFFCRMFFEGATMSKPIANKLPKIFGNLTTQNAVAKNLNLDVTAVLAVALTVLMWFVLYRTKWGLRIRSVGEHPAAADSLGISVTRVRYLCVLLSGVFAGFGGSCMTLDIITQYTPTAISGQGFIALAAVIFGKWTPQGAYGACLLFGFAQALTVVLGGGKFAVPSEILAMLPYVLTILVLILFVGRAVAPKEDGIPYEKGAR